MEENEGSFKTKTSKILARTKVWPLGKSKFSAFGHLTEKVWNAIAARKLPFTDTVDLEYFRDSLYSSYLHKYSHFTREISF